MTDPETFDMAPKDLTSFRPLAISMIVVALVLFGVFVVWWRAKA